MKVDDWLLWRPMLHKTVPVGNLGQALVNCVNPVLRGLQVSAFYHVAGTSEPTPVTDGQACSKMTNPLQLHLMYWLFYWWFSCFLWRYECFFSYLIESLQQSPTTISSWKAQSFLRSYCVAAHVPCSYCWRLLQKASFLHFWHTLKAFSNLVLTLHLRWHSFPVNFLPQWSLGSPHHPLVESLSLSW